MEIGDFTYCHFILKDKWKLDVLWQISLGNTSIALLKEAEISEEMLQEYLNELIELGFVETTLSTDILFLSEERGTLFLQGLKIMESIGKKMILSEANNYAKAVLRCNKITNALKR